MRVGLHVFHVEAVERFASLLGIAWYKKVTLEPQVSVVCVLCVCVCVCVFVCLCVHVCVCVCVCKHAHLYFMQVHVFVVKLTGLNSCRPFQLLRCLCSL